MSSDPVCTQVEHWSIVVCCGALIPLFTLLGLPGNVLNAVVFYRQGLRERINLCLFALAIVDLTAILVFVLFNGELFYWEVVTPSYVVMPIVVGELMGNIFCDAGKLIWSKRMEFFCTLVSMRVGTMKK